MAKKKARLAEIEKELPNVKNYGKIFSQSMKFTKIDARQIKKIKQKYSDIKTIKPHNTKFYEVDESVPIDV